MYLYILQGSPCLHYKIRCDLLFSNKEKTSKNKAATTDAFQYHLGNQLSASTANLNIHLHIYKVRLTVTYSESTDC
jgi:hypothetical protein